MSDNNIVAEFNNLGVLAQKLEDTGRYDVGMLISGLKHLLTENNFFYGPLVDQAPVNDPSRVFFDLKVNPAVHQLVYVHLGGGYAKEMRGPHWCYVVKNNGQKLTVIPLTSIKEDSGPAKEPLEALLPVVFSISQCCTTPLSVYREIRLTCSSGK